KGPGEAVGGQGVLLRQIVDEVHVIVILHQRALHQRGGAVAPAPAGIQGGGLRGNRNHHLVPVCLPGRLAAGPGGASGQQGQSGKRGQNQRKDGLFHGDSSYSVLSSPVYPMLRTAASPPGG